MVKYSWYADSTDNRYPANGVTQPVFPKNAEAHSWLKAPRYQEEPYEAGPLARMWVNGSYSRGISVIDRHLSRAEEAAKIVEAMKGWLDELQESAPVYREYRIPQNAAGIGLTEAPRGALGHWHTIASSRTGRLPGRN